MTDARDSTIALLRDALGDIYGTVNLTLAQAREIAHLALEETDGLARPALPVEPPANPDGVCGPTGGNTTPLSDIAAMAVDLGAPDLSSTFRQRRGASLPAEHAPPAFADRRGIVGALQDLQRMGASPLAPAPDTPPEYFPVKNPASECCFPAGCWVNALVPEKFQRLTDFIDAGGLSVPPLAPAEARSAQSDEPEVGAGQRAPWRICKGCGEPFDHGRVPRFCESCVKRAIEGLRTVTKGSDLGRDQLALSVLLAVDRGIGEEAP